MELHHSAQKGGGLCAYVGKSEKDGEKGLMLIFAWSCGMDGGTRMDKREGGEMGDVVR